MKIVSWNANGKFREKFVEVLKLEADVYVIQECENPESVKSEKYREAVRNGFWLGDLSYKGIMLFSPNPEVKIELLDWAASDYRFFIPVRVNDSFTLVGAWACNPYIEEFYDYMSAVKPHFDAKTVIIGDFNSNAIWDKEHMHSGKTHSVVVSELKSLGLEDIYHAKTGEAQGRETKPTFFLYRHLDKPYHIDHCFAHPREIKSFKVHTRWQWLSLSDHLPIEIEL